MLTRNVGVQLKSDRISMRVVHAQLPRMRFPHRVVTGFASAMTRATSPMTTRAAELCYKSTRDPARPPIADRLRWPAVPGVPSYPSSSTDSRGVHVSRAVQCSAVQCRAPRSLAATLAPRHARMEAHLRASSDCSDSSSDDENFVPAGKL